MLKNVRTLKLKDLLFYFSQDRPDKKFCFILGAGASIQSGIKMGKDLAETWIKELKESKGIEETIQWMTENGINENNIAEYYPLIYDKRFEIDPSDGFYYIEKEMTEKEPSCGYSVLAQVLAQTGHNVIITTNFDSLVEDAMFMYTHKRPLICGHESLASYIRPIMSRPLIAKIHRDVLLSPYSDDKSTSKLHDNWVRALTNLFSFHTPIVIGYGGNDGSLMGFLNALPVIKGGIFWCYWEKGGEPKEVIQKLVAKHGGFIIPIAGFDEFMIQLNSQMHYEFLDKRIIEFANKRAENYRKQIADTQKNIAMDKDTKKAFEKTVKEMKEGWWAVSLEASVAKTFEEKEKILLKGINDYPDSAELFESYAYYLGEERIFDRSVEYHQKAIEKKPDYDLAYDNLGWVLGEIAMVKTDEEKEKLLLESIEKCKKAIEINPNFDKPYDRWGWTLGEIAKTKSGEEKEKLLWESIERCKKAVEINPNNDKPYDRWGWNLGEIASLKEGEVKEKLLWENIEKRKKAIEINPNNELAYDNWGWALGEIAVLKSYEEKEKLLWESIEKCKKAIEINPGYDKSYDRWGWNLGEIALLKEGEEKEKLLWENIEKRKKAIEIIPNNDLAYENWGWTLEVLANLKTGAEKEKLLNESKEKKDKAQEIILSKK